MDVVEKEKYQFSVYIFGYLVYVLDVILSDYICYLTKVNYNIALCAASLVMVVFAGCYIKKVGVVRTEYNFVDILFVGFVILVCFWRGVLPESSFDTSNYHLYFQSELGRDFVHGDFFTVRSLNAQTIALGDRMFGVSRRILGYRMGTMLNTFAAIAIYFQMKKVVVLFGRAMNLQLNSRVISLLGIVSLLTESIYSILATYMIDLLTVPIAVQMFLIVVQTRKEDEYVKGETLWLCIMAGMLFCMKISNILIVLPLAVLYLIKRWGKLKVKVIAAGLAGAILMFALYAYISYDLTGNPCFPYLNAVFKSEWFSVDSSPNDYSGFNERFGPKGVIETVFWPLYMVIHPEKASEIACSGRLLIAVIAFLFFGVAEMISAVKENKKGMFLEITGILLLYYLIFLFALKGYMRYIIILELFGSVMALVLMCKYVKKRKVVNYILAGVLGVLLLVQIKDSGEKYFVRNYEWSWRNVQDKYRMRANLPKVFHDYGSGLEPEVLDDIKTLLIADYSNSFSVLLKPEARIINLISGVTNEATGALRREHLQQMPDEGIYSLESAGNISVDGFSEHGLRIAEFRTIQPDFCDAIYSMPLIKLERSDKVRSAECQEGDSVLEFELAAEDLKVDLFVGDNPGAKYDENSYHVIVRFLDSETGETEFIDEVIVERTGFFNYLGITVDPEKGWDKIVAEKNADNESSGHCAVILQRYY